MFLLVEDEELCPAGRKALRQPLVRQDDLWICVAQDIRQPVRGVQRIEGYIGPSRFQNAGQSCIAAKRFIVVDDIADSFLTQFKREVEVLRPGDPSDDTTTLAPMARGDLRDELHRQVSDSIARGAVAESKESLRISQNRYQGGLITLSDLLRDEEAALRAETNYWQAVYRLRISHANLELATGTLDANSPVVKP